MVGLINPTLESKEKEVLKIACEFFLERGYHGTSLSQMTRECNISKESLYRYFDSKEDLFLAVINTEIARYNSALPKEIPKFQNIRPALIAIGETIAFALNSDRLLALRRLVFQEAAHNPRIGHRYFQMGSHYPESVLEAVFTAHKNESKDINPRYLAHYYKSMIGSRLMFERECQIRPLLTNPEIVRLVDRITTDFLMAFFNIK